MIHAFTQKEAKDCFQSLKLCISSSIEVERYIELTPLQLKYMQNNRSSVIRSPYIKIVASQSSIPKFKIKGSKLQVERCATLLQRLLCKIILKSHQLTHYKYILMWKKCWQELNEEVSQDKELYSELTTSVSGNSITCKLVVAGENGQKVDNAILLIARKIDGSVKQCKISADVISIRTLKEGLKSKKLNLRKDLLYDIEFEKDGILIISPYCIQAEEVRKVIENFIFQEKIKRKIITKRFEIEEYSSCIIKQLRLHWNKVQEIAKGNKILSINLVTDLCCAIEMKGNEAAIKQAEPQILQHISSLESNLTHSTVSIDYYSSPALQSPEILHLCKDLESELTLSVTLQVQPKVLSSATINSSLYDVKVEVCEGSIALDNCDVFVNFTDANLSISRDLKNLVGKSAAFYYKCYAEGHGPQLAGKAVGPVGKGYLNQKVIHAVMPKWVDGKSGENDAITSAVVGSLKLAVKHNAKSVSLPFLSCIDKALPIDYLADACLTGLYLFCVQSIHIRVIRLVLPSNIAGKFHQKFTVGLFKEWIKEEKLSSDFLLDDTNSKSVGLIESFWLWEDDYNHYIPYEKYENSILNQKSAVDSSCNLTIGRFSYIINFTAMTQTNIRTQKVRKIKHVTNDYIWVRMDSKKNWKHFALQNSKEIEIMYVTGSCHSLIIDGKSYIYDFSKMVQINKQTFHETPIRRIHANVLQPALEIDKDDCTSNIHLFGLDTDITLAKERLNNEIKSLTIVKCIDIQPKFTSLFGKHVKSIQKNYNVKISQCPLASNSVDIPVKYNITGYKYCVPEAITAIYQALSLFSNSLVQSFPKPAEWDPQSNPIELKDVPPTSTEWNKILQRMQETIPGVNLVSIKRIQNEFLWEKYCQHKERMSRKGQERINEMELFHGTSSNPPEDIYKSEEGFDMRFSRSGMWGQGNYFAESAQYSCSYAYKKDQLLREFDVFSDWYPTKQIFLVKVLTGDSYTSSPDKTLRMPPYKLSASSEKVRYDTVNGMAHGSKIYITYSNDKAYPLYLISLKY